MNERPDAVCATCGTDEKALYSQVAQVIQQYKDKEGSLIMVLHAAQEIFGYLPMQLQEFIADGMDLPVSEVSGVVSFYSFFSTQKRGKHTIRMCQGTACYVRGGKKSWTPSNGIWKSKWVVPRRTASLPLKLPDVSVPAAWPRR